MSPGEMMARVARGGIMKGTFLGCVEIWRVSVSDRWEK